jgi:HAD superfamily hydrolase (TIGR01549 family)
MKAVIWDFDGTICDTYPAIAGAVNDALARFGQSASFDRIVELSSISLDRCIRTLATEHAIPYDQLDAAFVLTYQAIQPSQQPPFPGVLEICQRLVERGVLNFIVTHRRRASLTVLLTSHGLLSLFTEIIAADDGFPKKPAPDAIIHLLTTYAIAPEDALVIGDRESDILAGQAAGVPTCLFQGVFPENAFGGSS